MWGFKEGMSRPLGTSNSWKLRINSILNGCTRRGSFLGNSAGILGMLEQPSKEHFHSPRTDLGGYGVVRHTALFYNGVNSSIDAFRGHHDIMGGMAAGAISGAMFKATGGFTETFCLSAVRSLLKLVLSRISWCTVSSGVCHFDDGSVWSVGLGQEDSAVNEQNYAAWARNGAFLEGT
jgi:hypothetical protein